MRFKPKNNSFAVIGLGRYGMSVLKTLSGFDVNLLAVDSDERKTREAADYATHVAQIDMSDEFAVNTIGIGNYDVVIIAMSQNFEAVLTTAMIAKEKGAKHIISKARNQREKAILLQIGVNEAVLPEHEMGEITAKRLIRGSAFEILGDSEAYDIDEISPKNEWVGKSLFEADVRRKTGMNIIGVIRDGKTIIELTADFKIAREDSLIVFKAKPVF